jgi:ribose-phosphate pyrophosphokinase
MDLNIVVGSASERLGDRICHALHLDAVPCLRSSFPDGELEVVVCKPLRGDDVFIVQSTSPPVERHLMELLLLADACRRQGAGRITAVMPYFGYARHDRRTAPGKPVAVRVVADLLRAVGIDGGLVVDPHIAVIEAVVGMPFERLTALPALSEKLREHAGPDTVVVAPDLGAVKLARRFGDALGADTAFVDKRRLSGTEVRASAVIGDVRGKRAVIVDDMISTGGTIVEAARALHDAGAAADLVVAATHGLYAAPAARRLRELAPEVVLSTDTVSEPVAPIEGIETVSVVQVLASAVRAMHEGQALDAIAAYD